MRQEETISLGNTISLENRSKLVVTGVSDVDSYDDGAIVLSTNLGQLTVRGNDLKISKLNTEFGELIVTGNIDGMVYTDERGKTGFFGRLLK